MLNLVNPYHAGYGEANGAVAAPFAGRKDALARLYARLSDPVNFNAILFLGWRRIGKTALLLNADAIFKDTALGVYVPLSQIAPQDEAHWLLALAQTMTTTLVDRGFTLSRMSQLDPPGENPRSWFETTFLPPVLGAVRRKLLLLLDDADRLQMGVRAGQLPDDTFAYLRSLAERYRDLHLALTLDAEYEDHIDDFAPLVTSNDVVRLGNLAPDETEWLLQAPVQGLYSVPDDCALAVHRVVGGAPGLVQHFGYELFRRWESYPELNVFTLQDVRSLTTSVYLYNEADYRYLWERLDTNERLILTAISGLLYNDPLASVDASRIEGWLVETDYPLDITAINATLRSLEYREILQPTPEGISLSAEIMQNWLLENARLGRRAPAVVVTTPASIPAAAPAAERAEAVAPAAPANPFAWITPRLLRTLAIIFILLLIANVIAYVWVNSSSPTVPPNVQPTVTLVTSP